MGQAVLEQFMSDVRKRLRRNAAPEDCVGQMAPLMYRLLDQYPRLLSERSLRPDPAQYARHAVCVDGRGGPSLYAMVWMPGQWTPVHDHGTWGVVGILQGMLQENAMCRMDPDVDADQGIELRRAGSVMLTERSVTTFLPYPDHIHETGAPAAGEVTVSLHLYGQAMNAFHIYDVAEGTRERTTVCASQGPASAASPA